MHSSEPGYHTVVATHASRESGHWCCAPAQELVVRPGA